MTDFLNKCIYPSLGGNYDVALRDAIEYIVGRFDVIGIIAAGSIIRGTPDATSDFDIHVLHHGPYRQRFQKFFRGVPAEIFINPPCRVEQYLAEEHADGCPSTATMFTDGFVVYNGDPVVDQLREQARKSLETPPQYSEEKKTMIKYTAATLYEDALEIIQRDPAAGIRILSNAIGDMLHYYFLSNGMFIPRLKDRNQVIRARDPQLAEKLETFYLGSNFDERLSSATCIAERTIGVTGFFEWESKREEIK